MFYKFIYLDKKTGQTVRSQKELEGKNLKLIKGYKNTAIKNDEFKKKTK